MACYRDSPAVPGFSMAIEHPEILDLVGALHRVEPTFDPAFRARVPAL
jgi:hypothetical protein